MPISSLYVATVEARCWTGKQTGFDIADIPLAASRSETGCSRLHTPVAHTQSLCGLHRQQTRGASGATQQQQDVVRMTSSFAMALQSADVHLVAHQMLPAGSMESMKRKASGTARGSMQSSAVCCFTMLSQDMGACRWVCTLLQMGLYALAHGFVYSYR